MNADNKQARLILRKAYTAMQSGDRREAHRLAEKAASLDPNLEEAWLLLASVSTPRASISYINQALTINPGSPRARKGLQWAQKRLLNDSHPSIASPEIQKSKNSFEGLKANLPTSNPNKIGISRFPFAKFLVYRVSAAVITFLIITAIIFALYLQLPAETRAGIYWPSRLPPGITIEREEQIMEKIIQTHHMRDSFPVQYLDWISNLAQGNMGWSPTLREDVWSAIQRRSPITLELTIYSILFFIPLGLASGLTSGINPRGKIARMIHAAALTGTSIPTFIMALVGIVIFYVGLGWFPPGRIALTYDIEIKQATFFTYTGFLTIDGFLNHRPEISLDAFRHLVLPVITLSLIHWSTLSRIMRIMVMNEISKDYVTAAGGRGLSQRLIKWRHIFPNAVTPALTSSALAAASLVTGIFTIEIIFGFHGISEISLLSLRDIPDVPAVLGFAIYSVIMVQSIMILVDIIKVFLNPFLQEG